MCYDSNNKNSFFEAKQSQEKCGNFVCVVVWHSMESGVGLTGDGRGGVHLQLVGMDHRVCVSTLLPALHVL